MGLSSSQAAEDPKLAKEARSEMAGILGAPLPLSPSRPSAIAH